MDTTIDFQSLPTPSYVVDETLLRRNLEILKSVKDQTGCKILLAQKAFSMYHFYPLIAEYLDGTTASSVHEAQLGFEEFGKETHVFAPAFKKEEMEALLPIVDHIVFNSPNQVKLYAEMVKNSQRPIEIGLRVNPELSTQDHALYDPASPFSRLGTTAVNFDESQVELLDGLHFHTLCEQGSDALEATLVAFEEKFGKYLHGMKWVNFGGGHHITKEGYDIAKLVKIVNYIKEKYAVQVYLEPGEAIALNAGFLVASVLETTYNQMNLAILDTSATCHMPDVLEMPYRPFIIGSGEAGEKAHTYRLGGQTCLAGDVIGDYSFDEPLQLGNRLIFTDMAIYSMVKNTTFNGIQLPAIAAHTIKDGTKVIKTFGYEDFKSRL